MVFYAHVTKFYKFTDLIISTFIYENLHTQTEKFISYSVPCALWEKPHIVMALALDS